MRPACAGIALAAAVFAGTAGASEPPRLFKGGATRELTPAERLAVPEVTRARIVTADVVDLRDSERLELNLFDDLSVMARRRRVEVRAPGDYSWIGDIEGVPAGYAIVVVQGENLAVRLNTGERVVNVATLAPGIHRVEEYDPRAFPECGGAPDSPDVPGASEDTQVFGPPVLRDRSRTQNVDDGSNIDVLVVWTPGARAVGGGGIAGTIQSWIDEINVVYENSDVMQRVTLVDAREVDYDESGGSTDLGRLRNPSDGHMDEVHPWRDELCADLVALIVGNARGICGIGYLMTNVSQTFASSGFSVTQYSCANGNLTLPHEMGHNMGCAHDRPNAGGSSHNYAYGYVAPNFAWRTVMAYSNTCPGGNCARIPHFSNPDIDWFGTPTGTGNNDNARALDANAFVVSNFRDSAVCSSSICVEDPFEPDNLCFSAPFFSGEDFRNYQHCEDSSDWMKFGGLAGETYTITTSALGSESNTKIQLLKEDCFSLVAEDDSGGVGESDEVVFEPTEDGCYALRLSQVDDGFGLNRQYTLTIDGNKSAALCCPDISEPGTLRVNRSDFTLDWEGDPGSTYNVYRGTRSGQFGGYDHACWQNSVPGDELPADPESPGGDLAWTFYLVSGTADCGEGSIGQDSAGVSRPNSSACQ